MEGGKVSIFDVLERLERSAAAVSASVSRKTMSELMCRYVTNILILALLETSERVQMLASAAIIRTDRLHYTPIQKDAQRFNDIH